MTCFLLALIHAASTSSSKATDLDVVIIGAGAAGVGAASVLANNGVSHFRVLEATDVVGGRVHAAWFGSQPEIQIEQGANWISGTPGLSATNPLWSLALAVNLSTHRVAGSAQNMSNWEMLDVDGTRTDLSRPSRRDQAGPLQLCVARLGAEDRNLTAAAAVRLCGWNATRPTAVDKAILWQIFTGEQAVPPDAVSASGCLPDPTYLNFGADDYFVFEQRPRGFAGLLDLVGAGALDGGAPALDQGRLLLNTTVARVEYTCGGGATVHASDGRTWHARHVISTLPLGVLQRRGQELFTPPIGDAQRAALWSVAMGNYTKIFVQWPEPWWNVSVYKWAQANDGINGGDLPSVRNLAHASVLPRSNTLLFDLGDPQVRRPRCAPPPPPPPPPTAHPRLSRRPGLGVGATKRRRGAGPAARPAAPHPPRRLDPRTHRLPHDAALARPAATRRLLELGHVHRGRPRPHGPPARPPEPTGRARVPARRVAQWRALVPQLLRLRARRASRWTPRRLLGPGRHRHRPAIAAPAFRHVRPAWAGAQAAMVFHKKR